MSDLLDSLDRATRFWPPRPWRYADRSGDLVRFLAFTGPHTIEGRIDYELYARVLMAREGR